VREGKEGKRRGKRRERGEKEEGIGYDLEVVADCNNMDMPYIGSFCSNLADNKYVVVRVNKE
jgi:hypothetical protein